jgi:hypothetical protein
MCSKGAGESEKSWDECEPLYCGEEESVRFEVFTAVTMKNGVFWVKSHTA